MSRLAPARDAEGRAGCLTARASPAFRVGGLPPATAARKPVVAPDVRTKPLIPRTQRRACCRLIASRPARTQDVTVSNINGDGKAGEILRQDASGRDHDRGYGASPEPVQSANKTQSHASCTSNFRETRLKRHPQTQVMTMDRRQAFPLRSADDELALPKSPEAPILEQIKTIWGAQGCLWGSCRAPRCSVWHVL